jgi:hypothetical protein
MRQQPRLGGRVELRRYTAISTNTANIGLRRRSSTLQTPGMDTDHESLAIIEPVETSAPVDIDDSLRFVRGLLFGLACAVPLWAAVIAALWLAF